MVSGDQHAYANTLYMHSSSDRMELCSMLGKEGRMEVSRERKTTVPSLTKGETTVRKGGRTYTSHTVPDSGEC